LKYDIRHIYTLSANLDDFLHKPLRVHNVMNFENAVSFYYAKLVDATLNSLIR
jgi:hypothetical protein